MMLGDALAVDRQDAYRDGYQDGMDGDYGGGDFGGGDVGGGDFGGDF